MNAIEMGIELDMVLQQIDSERFDSLEPEESDALLTNAMFQFIENRISTISDIKKLGLQGSIKRTDELKSIIPNPILRPVYVDDSEEQKLYSIFPTKFHHLLKDSSLLNRNCAGLSYNIVDVYEESIAVVDFNIDVDPYNNLQIILNDTNVIFNINDYPNLLERLRGVKAKYYLIHVILEELYIKNYTVYYEYYAGDYYKDSFIFVINDVMNENTVTLSIGEDGETTQTVEFRPIKRRKVVLNTVDYVSTVRPNRLMKTEDLDNIAIDPILKTNYKSPVSTIENNLLKVYYNDEFIVGNIRMSYIKKPKMISKIMGYNCELPERYHREIVLLAAQLAKAYMNAEDYQLLLKENLKME